MNPEELQQNIALYYSKLPPNVQAMFSSMSWLETLKRVSEKYALNSAQVETLGTETTLVLLGIIHPEEYGQILKKELQIPQNSLDNLMAEINSLVINPIRPELTETFTANNEPALEEKKLDARFDKLPKEIQDAIIESNYHAVLYEIAEGYKLTIPQMDALEQSTTDVMLGNIKSNDFDAILQKTLGLAAEKTGNLVNEVNEKILKNIRMKMMSIQNVQANDQKVMNTYSSPINQDEANVLHSAGIKIIDPNLKIPEIAAPEHPIVSQKLADSFQIPAVKTEHTIENISKPPAPAVPLPPTTYPPKADPYRLPPE